VEVVEYQITRIDANKLAKFFAVLRIQMERVSYQRGRIPG
jgi:hypothetical protein